MLIDRQQSIVISSNPANGAINISPNGDAFEIQLTDGGIAIPEDAVNCTVSIQEATVWWVLPNIITGVNNVFYVTGDDNTLPIPVPQLFTVVIPQGLYDLTALNNSLQSGLEALGARTLDALSQPQPLLSLSPDNATQKVQMRPGYTNVTIDFTQADTPRDILGFGSLVYGPYAAAPLNILAPNVAAFNTVNSLLISSDIVNRGIRFNNQYNNILGQVLIDVAPGSQIVSTPFNPPIVNSDELIGAKRSNLRFFLTDDQLRSVNTNGEYWTARIVIKYQVPYLVEKFV